jgi:hypothetical protein
MKTKEPPDYFFLAIAVVYMILVATVVYKGAVP